ncbi:unnamed protein product [Meloidogyne enterolobii]|uniref:Uncharacterized protein n=1 Tax=Meloidogyne enterolobii TaxID=390850 RepID=A0ACB0YC72_MELEN
MKFARFLLVLIFIAILWPFVKTVSIRKSLARRAEKDNTAKNKKINDSAESSVNPQIEKYKETLTKNDTIKNNEENKVFTKSVQNKEYYQKK